MRKVIIIIILLFLVFLIKSKEDKVFIEKIDLNLNENEIGITFLHFKNSDYLLISKIDKKFLLILKNNEKDKEKLYEILNLFNTHTIDYLIYYSKNDFLSNNKCLLKIKCEVEEVNFIKNDNLITITYFNNKIGIVTGPIKDSLTGYTFLYFTDNIESYYSELNYDTKLIFYNKNVVFSDIFIEEIYSKWIDMYVIKEEEHTTLKLGKESYHMISIPNY